MTPLAFKFTESKIKNEVWEGLGTQNTFYRSVSSNSITREHASFLLKKVKEVEVLERWKRVIL